MSKIRCMINERLVEVDHIAPTMTLLSFLRDELNLTGTKEGCNEGDCGACTVILVDEEQEESRFIAINACLILMGMMHGRRIYTIEALERDGKRHVSQEVVLQTYASQCGYCTPGVIMSLFEASYRHDMTQPWQFVEHMAGNLCRCTGYRPILQATHEVAGKAGNDTFTDALREPAMEVGTLDYSFEGERFYLPKTLDEAFNFLATEKKVFITSGLTDVTLMVTKQGKRFPNILCLYALDAIRDIHIKDGNLHIGAAAPLSNLETICQDAFPPLARILRYFSSHQIKHVASVGGSVCGASPIGDMAPVLAALGATVRIGSARGIRELDLNNFFLGYRHTVLEKDEMVLEFIVPSIPKNARCASYKISKRQELDISALSGSFYVETDDNHIVTTVRMAYGGVAAKAAARAHKAEASLLGKTWDAAHVEKAAQYIAEDFTPISDTRASAWYRIHAAANLLRGFYEETKDNFVPKLGYRPSSTLQIEVKP